MKLYQLLHNFETCISFNIATLRLFTKVCHNIYRIKTCMTLGKPVILLNLDDLYESLYDALNQYFSTLGDKKYVDLGLGTHRVKTFVKDDFRWVGCDMLYC